MEIINKLKIEKFELFYSWLKNDGLIPRKSDVHTHALGHPRA